MKTGKIAALLLLILFSAVLGCGHLSQRTESGFSDTKSLLSDPRLQNMSVNSRCSVFDLSGKLLRRYNGLFCRFLDDGSFYASHVISLAKYDKDLHKTWEYGLTMNHHQLVLSPVTSNLLALDSLNSKKLGQHYREDILLIIKPGVKQVKRIEFSDVLKQAEKLGFHSKPLTEAVWVSKDSNPRVSILENSHVNSFYEIWDSNLTKVTGYIVNCYHHQKVYILDENADKLVKVIDMEGRKIHDVQFYDGKLLFYVNSDESRQEKWLSYIGSYDLESKKFGIIYESKDGSYSGNACSSVQMVSDGLFAILHSNCAPTPETTASPKLEIVDTVRKIRHRLQFQKGFPATNAYLFNSESFLRNNNGF